MAFFMAMAGLKPSLQVKSFKSVEEICGYTTGSSDELCACHGKEMVCPLIYSTNTDKACGLHWGFSRVGL
jgi:hypothetical protein